MGKSSPFAMHQKNTSAIQKATTKKLNATQSLKPVTKELPIPQDDTPISLPIINDFHKATATTTITDQQTAFTSLKSHESKSSRNPITSERSIGRTSNSTVIANDTLLESFKKLDNMNIAAMTDRSL